jgi:hypothetical protein
MSIPGTWELIATCGLQPTSGDLPRPLRLIYNLNIAPPGHLGCRQLIHRILQSSKSSLSNPSGFFLKFIFGLHSAQLPDWEVYTRKLGTLSLATNHH